MWTWERNEDFACLETIGPACRRMKGRNRVYPALLPT